MKRYDLITNYRAGSSIEEMEPADDGEWIRYEDVAGIISGYEQRMALIHWWSERCRDIRNGSPNAFYAHVDAFCKALRSLQAPGAVSDEVSAIDPVGLGIRSASEG